MDVDKLVEAWKFTKDPDILRLPVKTLKYNRCPAVAPLGVMKGKATQERLGLPVTFLTRQQSAEQIEHAGMARLGLRRRLQTPLGVGVIAATEGLESGAEFEFGGSRRHNVASGCAAAGGRETQTLYRGRLAR